MQAYTVPPVASTPVKSSNPRDSWPAWTDERWTITPDAAPATDSVVDRALARAAEILTSTPGHRDWTGATVYQIDRWAGNLGVAYTALQFAMAEMSADDPRREATQTRLDELKREIRQDPDSPASAPVCPRPDLAVSHLQADDESAVSLAPPSTPAPTKLAIFGFTYAVRPIPIHPEIGTVAFELHKTDTGNHYHAYRDTFGVVRCDCPDYLFRHDGTDQLCKHGNALVARGMMPAPSPVSSTLGRRVMLTPTASILENATPRRIEPKPTGQWVEVTPYLAVRPSVARRLEPTPDERAEAAQLFGDLEADRQASWNREYAAAL